MIAFSHLAPDPEATEAIGRALAGVLLPGDVVALEGELGAGKTTFVRAVAAHLGVEPGLVSSPTFVMVNQYPVPQSANASPLRGGQVIHVDAYRLSSTEDLETLGWDRLFDAGGQALGHAAAFIEWPSRIRSALPPHPARVVITQEGPTTRRLDFELPDSWLARPGVEWLRDRAPIRCPKTARWVSPTSPTYPFADAKARDADLFGWFTGSYSSPREIKPEDEEAV
jgi:tRNA threonylcarbamoyladenosine biosynthesis protein TsaE